MIIEYLTFLINLSGGGKDWENQKETKWMPKRPQGYSHMRIGRAVTRISRRGRNARQLETRSNFQITSPFFGSRISQSEKKTQ